MTAEHFGRYLLENKVVSLEALLDAAAQEERIQLPLCALAVGKGYFNSNQLRRLDSGYRQSRERHIDLALKSRMLGLDQLEELSSLHPTRWERLAEALLQTGHLTLVQLSHLLKELKQGFQRN